VLDHNLVLKADELYSVGDIATDDVVAPRHVDYVSQSKTQQERQVATSSVSTMFRYDAGIAQEQQSFKTIMGKGYEIKSVTFARGEATDNREVFVITLQKEKSVAVCYFAAPNWINLNNQFLEDSKRCDVR